MNEEYSGISSEKYYFDKKIRVLEEEVLGENAKNVTIVTLSLNRYEHTLLLLKSLNEIYPDYAGEILIADNGSDKEELQKIKQEIEIFPFKVKLYEFGENLGVAKGRNKAFALVRTEWIFSLDNDIFFVENPFPKVEETIRNTGAKFCNLPLLDEEGKNYVSNGGHLWINEKENGDLFVSCGPIFMLERNGGSTEAKDVLSTYLFGGCAFYHRETFLNSGGFDERFFVGFEDIDYSLMLYRKGYKIANSFFACLVHNHPKQKLSSPYDKNRYKYDVIKKGAKYFQEKNGLKVWDEVTEQFFIEQSLKEDVVEREKITMTEVYEMARANYEKICSTPFLEIQEEDAIAEMKERNSVLEQALDDLRAMNEELRTYSEDQKKDIEGLRIYSKNQEKAIENLKSYSKNQEKTIESLITDSKNQEKIIKNLKNYSEDQNKDIERLRIYSANQEEAIRELKDMNQELREYSTELERVITDLKKQAEQMQELLERRKITHLLKKYKLKG